MKPQIYTASELAKILKCDAQTVYRLGNKGIIKRLKVGKLVRFYMPDERSVEYDSQDRKRNSIPTNDGIAYGNIHKSDMGTAIERRGI